MQTRIELTVQSYSSWDEQRLDIEIFGDWLRVNTTDFFILPPVSIYTFDGQQKLAFVLRRSDTVVGVFESPAQALQVLGEDRLFKNVFRIQKGKPATVRTRAGTRRGSRIEEPALV